MRMTTQLKNVLTMIVADETIDPTSADDNDNIADSFLTTLNDTFSNIIGSLNEYSAKKEDYLSAKDDIAAKRVDEEYAKIVNKNEAIEACYKNFLETNKIEWTKREAIFNRTTDSLNATIAELRENTSKITEELTELRKEKEKCDKDRNVAEYTTDICKEELKILRPKLKEAESLRKSFEAQLKEANLVNQQLTEEIEIAKSETNYVKLNEANQTIHELREEISRLNRKIEVVEASKAKLEEDMKESSEKIGDLWNQVQKLIDEKKLLEKDYVEQMTPVEPPKQQLNIKITSNKRARIKTANTALNELEIIEDALHWSVSLLTNLKSSSDETAAELAKFVADRENAFEKIERYVHLITENSEAEKINDKVVKTFLPKPLSPRLMSLIELDVKDEMIKMSQRKTRPNKSGWELRDAGNEDKEIEACFCLAEWQQKKAVCPVCDSSLPNETIFPLLV
ncbi:unnamed protein product [Caenorhabditis bovis]|uniref:Uncharacterized protein n=1 Tax=Caenorhabditis bovis TaxID=2654633 RepID=A0A8S1F6W7_9PELO|nr:unnamed protein product [Caenorhabditis bovis]